MSQEVPIDIRAVKLQELERQAMEQYRNSNEKQNDSRSEPHEDKDCSDGRRCSGYGQCSPSGGSREKKGKYLAILKSTDLFSKKLKITLLKMIDTNDYITFSLNSI